MWEKMIFFYPYLVIFSLLKRVKKNIFFSPFKYTKPKYIKSTNFLFKK